jgi:hypothetical protein
MVCRSASAAEALFSSFQTFLRMDSLPIVHVMTFCFFKRGQRGCGHFLLKASATSHK